MQHIDARAQVALKQRVLEDTLWHLGRVRARDDAASDRRSGLALSTSRSNGGALRREERAACWSAFTSAQAATWPTFASAKCFPKKVSDLLLPLRELVHSLTLHERLPQIEVAVGSVMDRTAVMLVFRVLQPPTAEDCRLLREFGRNACRSTSGCSLRAPIPRRRSISNQAQRLELRLPEFNVALPFSPTDFTQVNHRVNEVLVSRVVRLLAPMQTDVVADFFCGLGNFTLPLATLAKRVVGLEGSASLVERARIAADSNGLADQDSIRGAQPVRFQARRLALAVRATLARSTKC